MWRRRWHWMNDSTRNTIVRCWRRHDHAWSSPSFMASWLSFNWSCSSVFFNYFLGCKYPVLLTPDFICLVFQFQCTNLVTGRAPRLERFRMVSSAVETSISPEVDEVHQQLPADAAGETGWMPAGVGPGTTCEHCDVATGQGFLALQRRHASLHGSPRETTINS